MVDVATLFLFDQHEGATYAVCTSRKLANHIRCSILASSQRAQVFAHLRKRPCHTSHKIMLR